MKRIAMALCAALGLLLVAQGAQAGWGSMGYGGYQPWWNIFAHRNRMSVEEERLQRFWHDYYHALQGYYCNLDHVDWVSYYKNHGYQINTGGAGGMYCGANGGSQRIQFAPVFVSPSMQWAVPNGNSAMLGGPPPGPMGPGAGNYGPSGPPPYGPSGPGPMPYGPGPGPAPYGPPPYGPPPYGPGPMPYGPPPYGPPG
jgi:hypothetical protein